MLSELAIQPIPVTPRRAGAAERSPEDYLARAAIYRLVAGAFVEEPDAAYLAALRQPEALSALAETGVEWGEDFLATPLPDLVEALAREYTVLFVASGGFPPVESVRLTGRYQQGPHFDVKATYARAGFQVRGGRFRVFEDQIGVELLFVAELLERAADELERGNEPACLALERDIRRFWALHLGRWARGYARLVMRAAEHSFFQGMAALLLALAEAEIDTLGLRVDDVDQARLVVPKQEVQVEVNPDEPVCGACGVADLALPARGARPARVSR